MIFRPPAERRERTVHRALEDVCPSLGLAVCARKSNGRKLLEVWKI